MQTKNVPFRLDDIKASGDGWEFSGLAAVFDVEDLGADIIEKGAFDATLRARGRRPLLWMHDQTEPIGLEKSLEPTARGLFGTWKIIDTQRGADAYKLIKAHAIDALSIGYQATQAETDRQGVRHLREIELLEVSVVTLPMAPDARISDVKRRQAAGYGARPGRTRSEQEGLDLAVRLELMRRKLVSRGVILGEGPLAVRMALTRHRIALRQHGVHVPGPAPRANTNYGRNYR